MLSRAVCRVGCTVYFAIVDLVDVELGALFASLCVAFLVLGLDAPKSVPFASRHQVPAHESQVAIVAPEEIAFVGPLAVIVCAGDLYVSEPDHDSHFDPATLPGGGAGRPTQPALTRAVARSGSGGCSV